MKPQSNIRFMIFTLNIGIFIQKYPAILGEDVAGVVAAVGSGVTRVKVFAIHFFFFSMHC